MQIKAIAVALAITQAATFTNAAASTVADTYWKSFKSPVDPNNVVLPSIPQTTLHDAVKECTYYETPASFNFDPAEWPTTWETATSNGMSKSKEFLDLYNSLDWKSMPDIPVRKLGSNGAPDMSSYDSANDPDCWWSATTCTKPKHENINADIYNCPEPQTWGLTYDDGPNCSHNAFYDFLQEKKLKASMFYSGSNVLNWPLGALRGIKDGHHIADHTWSHQLMTTLTNEEVLAELYFTQKAIKLTTGVTPRIWRPAFGDVDDRVRWIATQLGLTTALWDLDTDDWTADSPETQAVVEATYDKYIKMGTDGTYAKSGNIVLTHEIDGKTMELAMKYLPKIQTAYKHVVDIATCASITNPYFEDTVVFPTFASYVATGANGGQPSSGNSSVTPAKGSSAAIS
ncbi:carbohydrate esterase family 4 protein, partial [Phycomyces blakesleeanus NRRL 1555(-)]